MSTFTSRLAAGIKANPLVAGALVVGVTGLVSIAGVMAWSNNAPTGNTIAKPQTAVVQKKDGPKDQKVDQKASPTNDNTTGSSWSTYADNSTNKPTAAAVATPTKAVQATNSASQVQLAATTQPANSLNNGSGATAEVVTPSAPVTPVTPSTQPVAPASPAVTPSTPPVAPVTAPPASTPPATATNLVANPSVEINDGTNPTGWISVINTADTVASFTYATQGHTGTRSLTVDLTTLGVKSTTTFPSAQWSASSVPVTPGKSYTFTDYYKATVPTEVNYEITSGTGVKTYGVVATAASVADWTQFTGNFTAPTDAASVVVYHVIAQVGSLSTDDYSLTEATGSVTPPIVPVTPSSKFDKARVSLTFDDGWSSIYSNGLPILQKYGMVSTQYLNSQSITGSYPDYMTYDMVKAFKAAGSELAWHTQTHADITTTPNLDAELTIPQDFLTNTATTAGEYANFASPYGAYNTTSVAAVMNKYQSHRSTDDGYNVKGATDFSNIKVKNVCGAAGVEACGGVMTTAAQVQAWIDEATVNRAWLVIVYHEVSATPNDSSYATTPANLDAELNIIKNSGITVQTVGQAIADLRSQL